MKKAGIVVPAKAETRFQFDLRFREGSELTGLEAD